MKVLKYYWPVVVGAALGSVLGALLIGAVKAEETLSGYYSYIDDGGCATPANILEADYVLSGGDIEVSANVRVSPPGGNCEAQAVSYTLSAEREFNDIWLFKVMADKQAVSAPYALLSPSGSPILRASDAAPLFAPNLPVGAVETVAALFGVSKDWGFGEFDLAFNIVPVDWAGHEDGQTVHVAYSNTVGPFTLGANSDFGAETFGDARVVWSRNIATCKLEYSWGLDTIDSGVPGVQYVNEAPFGAIGPPSGKRTGFGCGVQWALR